MDFDITDQPIFVVGSPRSGTTLMRGVMDAHPNIMCPPCETFLFVRCRWIFEGQIWEDHYSQLPIGREGVVDWFRSSVKDLFRRLEPVSGKRRFCEKTPGHALAMDLIHEVFPQARFIHMIRNGEQVVRSLQKIVWAPSGILGAARNARTWVRSVRTARASGERLGSERYMELRYEDLIADPETALRRVCDFIDEPFDERMLSFHLPENGSWGTALRPFPDPAKELARGSGLGPAEKAVFKAVAGGMMKELGYY